MRRLGPALQAFPVGYGADGDGRLYAFSMDLSPARIAVYDAGAGVVEDTVEIPGLRTWAADAAGDYLYFGPQNVAAGESLFWRYDLARGRLEELPSLGAHVSDIAAAPDGRVYVAEGGTAVVRVFDPRTGELAEFFTPEGVDDDARSVNLAATDDTLYVTYTVDEPVLLAVDRAGGAHTDVLPAAFAARVNRIHALAADGETLVAAGAAPAPTAVLVLERADHATHVIAELPDETHAAALVITGEVVYCAGVRSGTLFAYDRRRDTLEALVTPVPGTPSRHLARHDGELVGLNASGLAWHHEPAAEATRVVDLVEAGADAGAQAVQSLAAAGGRVYVGGNNAVAIHDVAAASVERRGIAGEPKATTVVDETLYLAVYPYGALWRQERDAAQPTLVAEWGAGQNRPRAISHDTATGLLLVGTRSDERGGGALIVFDPASGETEVHLDPLGGGLADVNAVTAHDGTAYLGGANAALAAWDLTAGEERWRLDTGLEGWVAGLVVAAETLYGVTSAGRLFTVDLATRELTAHATIAEGRTGALVASGRRLYAASDAELVRVDPSTGEATRVLAVEGAHTFGPPVLAVDDDGLLYLLDGEELVEVDDRAGA